MKITRKKQISEIGKFIIIATVWNDAGVRKISSKPIDKESLEKYINIEKDFLTKKEECSEEGLKTVLSSSTDWDFVQKEIFEYKLPQIVNFFVSAFYEIAEDGIFELNLEV